MRIMRELWEEKGYGYLNLSEQNLRDQAAKLEKTLGDVGQKISKSIGTSERKRKDESVECFQNVNTEDQDFHSIAVPDEQCFQNANIRDQNLHNRAVPDEQLDTLTSEARELLESSAHIYTEIHPCEGDFSNRTIDTRTKEKPTKGDLEKINKVIDELMKQCRIFPLDHPFSYLWVANCVLYSVVTAFLLCKGWKKQGSNRSSEYKSKRSKLQIIYEEEVGSIRKKISIAKAEIDRLKENRKVTKKGRRNRVILQKECKVLSIASLVSYMERQKFALRKLKRAFCRRKKNEEARVLNQQFKDDAGRVYANMRRC